MKHLIEKILPEQRKQMWFVIGLIGAAGLIAFVCDRRSETKSDLNQKPGAESVESAATYIPEGMVLVPIEVANYEALDALIGQFGVVDLFVSSDDPRVKARKVAENVKILRAPLNPSHFAVLVPDSESQKIVAYSGALTVVVQNPNKPGTTLVNPHSVAKPKTSKKVSRVIVEVSRVD